jgi:hypothetical protein
LHTDSHTQLPTPVFISLPMLIRTLASAYPDRLNQDSTWHHTYRHQRAPVAHDKQTGEHPDHSNIERKSVDCLKPQQAGDLNHCIIFECEVIVQVQTTTPISTLQYCTHHTSPHQYRHHKPSTENSSSPRHTSHLAPPRPKPQTRAQPLDPTFMSEIGINLKPKPSDQTKTTHPIHTHTHNTHGLFLPPSG